MITLSANLVNLHWLFAQNIHHHAAIIADSARVSVCYTRACADDLAAVAISAIISAHDDCAERFLRAMRAPLTPLALDNLNPIHADCAKIQHHRFAPRLINATLSLCFRVFWVRAQRLKNNDLATWLLLQPKLNAPFTPLSGYQKHFARARFDNDMPAYRWLIDLAQTPSLLVINAPITTTIALPKRKNRTRVYTILLMIIIAIIGIVIALAAKHTDVPKPAPPLPKNQPTQSHDIAIIKVK